MTNRPLERQEIETLKILAMKLNRRSSDWLGGFVFWNDAKRNVDAMLISGTNDGEDIVEELTDEDAKGRPWVMCRDNESECWTGPHKLIGIKNADTKYVVICNWLEGGQEVAMTYTFARPLTTEEKTRYSK